MMLKQPSLITPRPSDRPFRVETRGQMRPVKSDKFPFRGGPNSVVLPFEIEP